MKVLTLKLPNCSYNIHIEKNLLNNIGLKVKNLYSGSSIVIITDENVKQLYYKKLSESLLDNGFNIKLICIKPGEQSKSLNNLNSIYYKLSEFGINRNNLIISFGGGVVGDLTGYAASTYLRGIPYIQIPTTLLAQVDSSVGGKVAVNLDCGKNLVGSFYHPLAVFIDTSTLCTLSNRVFADGMAEVIKYGAIKSKSLFNNLLSYKNRDVVMNHIDDVILECCSIKKSIVELDEKDTGLRMLLNFGHTLGHAVEKYYNYNKFTHGEAVALGMSVFTYKSEQLGITQKDSYNLLKNLLSLHSLPVSLPVDIKMKTIIDTILMDKKSKDNSIDIVLLKSIGNAFLQNTDKLDINNYLI